eukprot:1280450-Amorphochlora_amoeboformis.AAC.1
MKYASFLGYGGSAEAATGKPALDQSSYGFTRLFDNLLPTKSSYHHGSKYHRSLGLRSYPGDNPEVDRVMHAFIFT